jgi:hypothetical protein
VAGEALVHWLTDQSADEAPRSLGGSSTSLIRPARNTADRDRP